MIVEQEIERPQWPIFASVRLDTLKERGKILLEACEGIQAKCAAEQRDLTSDEERRFDDLFLQLETVNEIITNREAQGRDASPMETGRKTSPDGPRSLMLGGLRSGGAGIILGKTQEGEVIRGYRKNESLPVSGPEPGYDFGDWMRAAYSGDWKHMKGAQQEGVGADGGFLVPSYFSTRLIELIRNKLQVVNAGAITVPLSGTGVTFARQVSDPVAGWRGELQALPVSKATFAPVNFRAHAMGCIVPISEELLMDSPNISQVLETSLSQGLARQLDEAFLTGTGVGMPLGVTNASGVQTVGTVGAVTDYSKFSQAAGLLWGANFQPTALLYNAATATVLDGLQDTTGQPLNPPPSWQTYAHLITNQLPEVANTSTAILGDWSNYWIGQRMKIRIEISNAGTAGDISAFEQLALLIRAWTRIDGMPIRPEAFVLLPGITT